MKFTGVNLLDELERPELADLRAVFRKRSFAGGGVIFRPDEDEDLVFVVASGRVRVYLAYEDKEFTLAILNPGDPYSTHSGCYVQALEDAEQLAGEYDLIVGNGHCEALAQRLHKALVLRGFPNWEQVGNALKNDVLYEGSAYFLFECANAAEQMRHG